MTDEEVTAPSLLEPGSARTKYKRRMRVRSLQQICIPVKVPEDEVIAKTSLEFGRGDEIWSSVISTTDAPALSVDTSGLGLSTPDHTTESSIYSGSGADSITSSDVYGWEETLTMKSNAVRTTTNDVSSESADIKTLQYSRANGTKKGLLYKVLGYR